MSKASVSEDRMKDKLIMFWLVTAIPFAIVCFLSGKPPLVFVGTIYFYMAAAIEFVIWLSCRYGKKFFMSAFSFVRAKYKRLFASEREKAEIQSEADDKKLFAKNANDLQKLMRFETAIQDEEAKSAVVALVKKGVQLQNALSAHKDRIRLICRHIEYYQDRAVSFARVYCELEASDNISDEDNAKRTKLLVQSLKSIEASYDAAIKTVMSDDLSDIDAELEVMGKMLACDGLDAKSR